jgi:hypothetical protein
MHNLFYYKRIIFNICKNILSFKFQNINILPFFFNHLNNFNIENKRLFLVSSCLNPYSKLDEERFNQTINGLKSIRYYYDDSFIVFLENSILSESQELQIKQYTNLYLNYESDFKIKKSNKHLNKGVPQFFMFLKFLNENKFSVNFDYIHFISARYSIVQKINDDLIADGANFKFFSKTKNVSTRHFIFKNTNIKKIISILQNSYLLALLGCSVEDTIFLFPKRFNNLSNIFIKGHVSGIQLINE